MLFCPKCGSIMKPKQVKGKNALTCSCGYICESETVKISIQPKEKPREIVVVEKEYVPHDLVDAECKNCKHKKAYFWIMQTRSADEAPTRFFKCEKCAHTWREYK